MNTTMIRTGGLAGLLVLLTLLTACGRPRATAPDFRTRAFTATVAVTRGEMTYEAVVEAGAARADGGRDEVVSFTSPASLAGLTVTRTAAGVSLSLGDLVIPDGGAAALLDSVRLFEETGEMVSVVAGSEETVMTFRAGDCRRTWTLDRATSRPLQIREETGADSITVRVLSLTVGEAP